KLYTSINSHSIMSQQRCSQHQLLATQLLYAHLFQPHLSEFHSESGKTYDKVVDMVNFSKKKSDICQEDLPPTPSSQDNNNNNETLNKIDSCLRWDKSPSEFSNFHKMLSNLRQSKVKEIDKDKLVHQLNNCNKYTNVCERQENFSFFREHKNILIDVRNKLEQLSLLSSAFRQGHIDRNYEVDTALKKNVRRQLNDNLKTIEGMLDKVKQLCNQWSTAELFYTRSMQRLELNSDKSSYKTTVYSIMALAAIALSEECLIPSKNSDIKSDCVDWEKNDYKIDQKLVSNLGKPKTLTEIENIILQFASTVYNQQYYSGSDLSGNQKDNDKSEFKKSSSPSCIWHPKNKSSETQHEIEQCSTAAEIILEFASLSSSTALLNMNANLPSKYSTVMFDVSATVEDSIVQSPVSLNIHNKQFSDVSFIRDSEFIDQVSVTSATSTSNNKDSLIDTFSGNRGINQNRRKSKFARRIEIPTLESYKTNISPNMGDEKYFHNLKITPILNLDETALHISKKPISTMDSVTAVQERVINNIFKLNVLTKAACAKTDKNVGRSECESLPILDAPYDLTIGTKLKNMNLDTKNSSSAQTNDPKDISNDKKKPHIKKPLNAFMLYMKEMRAKVVAECTLKESAAINQILGRRWHELSREEQSKYYEKARQERQLHMELYPGWSARDNYGYVSKKKKRKKDRSTTDSGGNNMKKCRARFGLDQQNQWCKPCRRKKKCVRYMEAMNGNGPMEDGSGHEDHGSQLSDDDDDDDDDNPLGESCGSADENNKILDDDAESLNQSLSSPGCLSSLQSPSTRTSLASPQIVNINTIAPAVFSCVSAEQSSNLRTKSVSISGSSSGSTCSISTTPNTSSTVSPVTGTTGPSPISANERAMMLGNRFSHLGMGLSPPVINTTNNQTEPFYHTHPTVISNTFPTLPKIINSNCLNSGLVPKAPVSNILRSPIGANPRDINNPLSINQLTKRRENKNFEIIKTIDSEASVAQAANSLIHHVSTNNYHVNHTLLSSNLNQNFQKQLSSVGTSKNITPSMICETIDNGECKKKTDGKANVSITPSAGATETGVISVS
ncbi:hypothetical protein KR026_001187, partial [Drosophila bipectinata]